MMRMNKIQKYKFQIVNRKIKNKRNRNNKHKNPQIKNNKNKPKNNNNNSKILRDKELQEGGKIIM